MLSLLSILSGAIIAVMIVQNGGLAGLYGNYHSTVIIHVVGLVTILLWILLRREKFHWDKTTPWPYYLGGTLGVATVVANSVSFAALGVSLTLALGLLGQCLAGGFVDHFGLFGMPKLPFRKQHLVSFGLIVAGIVVMML